MAPGSCELCNGPAWTSIDNDVTTNGIWACDEHLETLSGQAARLCASLHGETSDLIVMIGHEAEALGRWLARQ